MILARLSVTAALALLAVSTGPSARAADNRTQVPRTEPAKQVGVVAPVLDEEKAERSRRALDAQAERLEREARRVMTTICRGC